MSVATVPDRKLSWLVLEQYALGELDDASLQRRHSPAGVFTNGVEPGRIHVGDNSQIETAQFLIDPALPVLEQDLSFYDRTQC